MTSTETNPDLVEQAEAVCKEAEEALLAGEPGARCALGLAMFLKEVALARRALNGGAPVVTASAQRAAS